MIGGTRITPKSAISVLSWHGRVQIDPYIWNGGAAFYTAKGINTDFCAYDILGQWPDLNYWGLLTERLAGGTFTVGHRKL